MALLEEAVRGWVAQDVWNGADLEIRCNHIMYGRYANGCKERAIDRTQRRASDLIWNKRRNYHTRTEEGRGIGIQYSCIDFLLMSLPGGEMLLKNRI